MASTSTKRLWWAKWVCQKQGAFPQTSILGKKTLVNPLTVDAWTALSTVLSAYGYRSLQSVWNYNCRPITGGRGYSLHAYGIATDIDPTHNPYLRTRTFSWAKTAFTKEQVDAVYRIKSTSGKRMFLWGGYWVTIKDYMHWEIDVHPNDMKVDWSTVDGGESMGPGDKGAGVKRYQQMLLAWKPTILPTYGADGDYGGETEGAVKVFQEEHDMAATGRVGDATGGLLVSYVAAPGKDGKDGVDGKAGVAGEAGPPGKTPKTLQVTEWTGG